MLYLNIIFFFLVISCLAVVFSRNPVQSVLFLVLVFIFNSLFFLVLGSDFLAILVLIIYVGAISTLFLFVVMMFDIRQTELQNFYVGYLPLGVFLGLFFFFELFYIFFNNFSMDTYSLYFSPLNFNYKWVDLIEYKSNIVDFSQLMFNHFSVFIFLVGLVLLVSMVGSIALTVDFDYRPRKADMTFSKYNFYEKPFLTVYNLNSVSFWNTNSLKKSLWKR